MPYKHKWWRFTDWRTPAALALLGMIIIVGFAFYTVLSDNSSLKDENFQLKEVSAFQTAQQECRSRAAVFTEETDIEADGLFSATLIAAVTDGVDVAPYLEATRVANRNRNKAIAERRIAVAQCTIDPNYEIPNSILEPVPSVPDLFAPA